MSQKKSIWIINQYGSTPDTGMGGRHFYLAQELVKLGYSVTLITASYHHLLKTPVKVSANYTTLQSHGINNVLIKMPFYEHAHSKKRILNWFNFANKLRGLKHYLTEKPDAILYTSPSLVGYLGAESLAKFYKVPLSFEVRDIWPLTLCQLGGFSSKHPFIQLLQYIEDRAYRRSNHLISNLKYLDKHIQSRGFSTDNFHWIPNGYSQTEVNKKVPLSADVKKQLPQGKFTIGYTGTLGVANCLDTLIEAASQLQSQTEIAFVIVGQGKQKEHLQNRFAQLKLNNVTFIDAIPKVQIQSMLAEFDVCYIGLTKDDLFHYGVSPNKLFDYFCSGKPIIYAIDSGEYQPVNDAKAGLQIEPENIVELVTAVQALKNEGHEYLSELGKNGQTIAQKHYEYSSLAKQLEQVIFKL